MSARPFEKHREAFVLPEKVCSAVPGWRGALVLYDADGLAASLIEEARTWTWGPLERRCDEWVAEEVTGYAEEVHKLAAALRNGNRSTAAVSVLCSPYIWRRSSPSTAASSTAPRTACGTS